MKKFISYIKLYLVKFALHLVDIDSNISYNKEYDFLSLYGTLWNCESDETSDVDFGIATHCLAGWNEWESYADPHTINFAI